MNQPSYTRLVFMGTPDFAVPSLQALLDAGEEVLAVYTQPDRPKGRGQKLAYSPVREKALAHHLPVFQPPSFKETGAVDRLAALKADLLIVVAYGLILPKAVLNLPTWGAVNVHASLLPKYRGAAPIQWAVINREKETGITTMRLDPGMDTGDMLLQETEPIRETDTAQSLHDRLAGKGAQLLRRTLERLREGRLLPQPQDHSLATYAPPLKKEAGEISWGGTAEEIDGRIRGMTPWPRAFTFLKGKRLIIHRAVLDSSEIQGRPGTIYSLEKDRIRVHTGQGLLALLEVQQEGHKKMSAADLVRGLSLPVGERLGRG